MNVSMYWTVIDGKNATILDKSDIGLTEIVGKMEDNFLSCSFDRYENQLINESICTQCKDN